MFLCSFHKLTNYQIDSPGNLLILLLYLSFLTSLQLDEGHIWLIYLLLANTEFFFSNQGSFLYLISNLVEIFEIIKGYSVMCNIFPVRLITYSWFLLLPAISSTFEILNFLLLF